MATLVQIAERILTAGLNILAELQAIHQVLAAQSTTLSIIANQLSVVQKDLEPPPIAGVVITTQIN
jgi:hypothetical protein